MKNQTAQAFSGRQILAGFLLTGAFVAAGLVLSLKVVGGAFSEAALFVRELSFENTAFLPSLRRAVVSDLFFCALVLIFATSYPVSILPGGVIAFESFSIGASVGLGARCCITEEAVKIFFAVFISNFLVLPLRILLFMSSVRFSRSMAVLSLSERKGHYPRFFVKVIVFFLLMCPAQCIQIGIGYLVLGIR